MTALAGDGGPAELRAAWAGLPCPKVLVVDDVEMFGAASDLADVLLEILQGARDSGDAVLAPGTTEDLTSVYRGFGAEIRRPRSGVLLPPTSSGDRDIFGLRLPRSTGEPAPAGRGLLVRAGAVEAVQVARGWTMSVG